jgi:hypothetical protein
MNTLEYLNYRKSLNDNSLADWVIPVKWEKSTVCDPLQIMHNINPKIDEFKVKDSIRISHEDEKYGIKKVEILYQKNIEPTLVKLRQTTHDGTLLFSMNTMGEIFNDLVNCATYTNDNYPENYLTDAGFFNYDIKYTVSDLLWHHKYVKEVDSKHGKHFPGVRESFALGVQIEFIKNSNNN